MVQLIALLSQPLILILFLAPWGKTKILLSKKKKAKVS